MLNRIMEWKIFTGKKQSISTFLGQSPKLSRAPSMDRTFGHPIDKMRARVWMPQMGASRSNGVPVGMRQCVYFVNCILKSYRDWKYSFRIKWIRLLKLKHDLG